MAEVFCESDGNLGKPEALEDAQPPLEPHSKDSAIDSPLRHGDMHVGLTFHIPMTQEMTLQDLPSQLDFD